MNQKGFTYPFFKIDMPCMPEKSPSHPYMGGVDNFQVASG